MIPRVHIDIITFAITISAISLADLIGASSNYVSMQLQEVESILILIIDTIVNSPVKQLGLGIKRHNEST